jgi:predicted negative regulator of RcsB-dependent stress response
MMENLRDLFHKIGFWFLIVFLIGVVGGAYGMHIYQKYQLNDSVLLKAFVLDKKVYDIKERL